MESVTHVQILDEAFCISYDIHGFEKKHESIFTNPSARAGYNKRLIFKQSLTGLNSEFPFS